MASSHSSNLIARFERSLHRLCPTLSKPNGERRIGLAISGGVDSMALAYMCSQFQRQKKAECQGERPRFQAFIVDHVAREGSGMEAKAVAERLTSMGTWRWWAMCNVSV
jgi:tRNA(Ile)-lysidine synthase TilS/MesJ